MLCGDRTQTLYTNAKMLPALKLALRNLQDEMVSAGISVIKTSQVVSNTLNALATVHPNPPNDLIVPLQMWEREDGSTSDLDWIMMEEREWDPAEPPSSQLRWWKFEDETIKFLGATVAKKVRLLYRKSVANVVSENSPIPLADAESYLSFRTAAICAASLGKNLSLAGSLNGEASNELAKFLNIRVQGAQNLTARMLPYSMFRR